MLLKNMFLITVIEKIPSLEQVFILLLTITVVNYLSDYATLYKFLW